MSLLAFLLHLCFFCKFFGVCSITLKPFEIVLGKLVQILSIIRLCAEIKKHNSTYIFYGFMSQLKIMFSL